ncbi:MAG: phosphoglycolate phosphatase [Robiginitomaculum sp.]|nr:MAG: phosphoglycolate phosphatase [Robiginitomaculum sp.]
MPLNGYTIVFDLDGTLVDTAPDLVRALNVCMQGSGIDLISTHEVRNLVGQGARALIERAFALGGIMPDPGDVDARLVHFLEDYSANIAEVSTVFDGAEDCMDALKKDGARLSICTNKPEMLTHKLLDAFSLKPHFDAIVCPENVSAKKPDAAHMLAAIIPLNPKKALMVGDSIADLGSARAAGIPAILMSHGYSTPPAAELGADLVLDHFSTLNNAIYRLLRVRPNS